ncbi:hypothetical protein SAMN02745124_00781 [Desulfofustis glycolicus DSM 9705]|uniref:Uncharacterized protein n=1 Tax=Desulfofustis glycolicus DSM 9705 TaxID=1121409 RepID=A0A1M5TL70_9BACT|nr:hypothetical protein SAMN02745124_00781 [Desulfofustis glycolicus DSM 9705]
MDGYLSKMVTALFFLANIFFAINAYAQKSICAQVKIEIRQEMTFERQAFDAHMQISNG